MILKKITAQEYPREIWKDTPSGHTREVIHPAGEGLGGHRKEYERRKTKTELLLLFFEMVYTLRRCKKFCG